MNTCDTCKYWGYTTTTVNVYGTDTMFHNICQNIRLNPGFNPGYSMEDAARGRDDRGIEVGAKFGCIHHEPLNDNKDQSPPVA